MEEKKITIPEKYFPKEWTDLILPDLTLQELVELKATKGYRAFLYSSPGTGKTTTARMLAKNDDVLYLSGSNDFKVEVIRQKIMPFASGFSVLDKQKTIIIDEFAGIKSALQENFMIILDQCRNVNFIIITNYPERVIDPVKSRFKKMDYDFTGNALEEQKRKFVQFAISVCDKENIKYDKDGLRKLFEINFPNFRNLLICLQDLVDRGEHATLDAVKRLTDSGKKDLKLYSLVTDPSINGENLYKELTTYKGKEKEALTSLGEPFFEHLNENNLFGKTYNVAIVVAKYSNMYMSTINSFATFMSAIVELKAMFK